MVAEFLERSSSCSSCFGPGARNSGTEQFLERKYFFLAMRNLPPVSPSSGGGVGECVNLRRFLRTFCGACVYFIIFLVSDLLSFVSSVFAMEVVVQVTREKISCSRVISQGLSHRRRLLVLDEDYVC